MLFNSTFFVSPFSYTRQPHFGLIFSHAMRKPKWLQLFWENVPPVKRSFYIEMSSFCWFCCCCLQIFVICWNLCLSFAFLLPYNRICHSILIFIEYFNGLNSILQFTSTCIYNCMSIVTLIHPHTHTLFRHSFIMLMVDVVMVMLKVVYASPDVVDLK